MTYVISILVVLVGLAISYFCGAIPIGLIVGNKARGIDIREHGSGNVGATNAVRTMGLGLGILVMVGDILKGACGCLIVAGLLNLDISLLNSGNESIFTYTWLHDLVLSLALLCVVGGHMFSPFMHFHGGKGIATAFGGLCVILPLVAIISLIVFAVVSMLTRYVSLGSIFGTTALPITCAILYGEHLVFIVFFALLALLIIYAHRENIKRLLAGTERRFSIGGKKEQQ